MRELIADLFISLDGFAGAVDAGPFFGYDGPELSNWVRTELNRPQVLLMGRNTYMALAGLAATAADAVSARMRELPKLVFSGTLEGPLAWKNTQVVGGDLAREIRTLKQQRGDPIRSIGSIQLVKGMMAVGLVDRLRLMVFPLILGGAGREPIYANHVRTALHLVGTTVLDSRIVLLEYGPPRNTHNA